MTNKIEVLNIEEKPQGLEGLDVAELASMPWREYLRRANYNKDPNKMCELCIAEQRKKFNGRTPIICNGLKSYKEALKSKYSAEVIETLEENLSEEELKELKSLFNPMDWFSLHMTDKDKAQERWVQTLILSCSAKNKVIRAGRRMGKSYSIIIDILFEVATTTKPLNILVAAPQVTMIDEIAQTFKELADALDIPNFIDSKKSSPILEIKFFNGSILKGITAGSDGTSARGKKADIIWLDEVDFIPTKAIDAIKAIQLDNPDVRMIYTSTPIGEGNLFNFAKQESTKEFHYPTFTRPDYTDEMHDATKSLSDIAYLQEITAAYGLDTAGVFSIQHIEKSYEFYIKEFYNEHFVLSNRERFIIFIGVDWNHDNNGSRIIVVAYDKQLDKFFKVEGHRISKIKMTQALAVDTIVEVNRKYNADHIICDEGFGTAQVSQLRLKGQEMYGKVPPTHPDIKLVDVESVQFGASLTITDPVTYQTIKKNTKQYIVENTQKLLEDHRLALEDYEDNDLILQMKNYHVASTGPRGNIYKPKDKKIGDHDLDAYMLALYGFDMFYGVFIRKQSIEYANILPKEQNYEVNSRDLQPTYSSSFSNKSFGSRSGSRGFKSRRSLW